MLMRGRRSGFTLMMLLVAATLPGCRKILPDSTASTADGADFVDATLNADVVVASQALNDQVTVEEDRLIFPASQEAEIRKNWPTGAPIVGGRRSGTQGNNVFGYLRRVTSVERDGENVVVLTERATIADVMVGRANVSTTAETGSIIDTTGVDLEAYFPSYVTDDGVPYGESGGAVPAPTRDSGSSISIMPPSSKQEVVVAPKLDPFHLKNQLEIFSIRTPKRKVGKVDVSLEGSLAAGGELTFKPRFRAEVDIGWTGLNFFEVEVGGDAELKAWLETTVEAKVSVGSDASDGVGLLQAMKGAPESPSGTKELASAGPFAGPTIIAVPTSFRVSLVADCSAKLYTSITTRVEGNIRDDSLKIGFRYEDGKGKLLGSQNFKIGGKVTLTAAGGAEVECGLSTRVSWLVADAAGPYLQVRGSLRAKAAYEETCNPTAQKSGRPDSAVTFSVGPIVKLQTGGVVKAFKVVDFGVGPLTLLNYEYPPFWQRAYGPWLGRGIGYCVADCQNGTRSGTETDVDCGGACLPCSSGKVCTAAADCKSKMCGDGVCAATACTNKVKDLGETDVDCGGGCVTCATGLGCAFDADCASGFCNTNTKVCVATSCTDAHLSGIETDVDCGSACANKCLNGNRCNGDADCDSLSCDAVTGRCVGDSCTDRRQSVRETDVDCGGTFCSARCAEGLKCQAHGDCASNACNAVTKRCVANRCLDAQKNEGEADVDCAGPCATKCATGKSCVGFADCISSQCNQNTHKCVSLTCQDGKLSPGETGVDCGGVCPYQCQLGKGCASNSDCTSGTCGGVAPNKVCVTSTCTNGVTDNGESDKDCGSSCQKKCGLNQLCNTGSDCTSKICTSGRCQPSGCLDKVKNGSETDIDCGGTCALNCKLTQGCQADGDCVSNICNQVLRVCVATRCEDGARTAPNETDIDCGGTCPNKCAPGKGCTIGGDCQSTLCNQVQRWCATDQCDDATKQANETDIDCGNFCSPVNKPSLPNARCVGGKGCAVASDCTTNVCLGNNTCQLGPCENGIPDVGETDLDCGGSLCPGRCTPAQHCTADADCVSGLCNNITTFCAVNSCGDGRTDFGETGVDCGQSCSPALCPTGQGCASNLDCTSGYCDTQAPFVCVSTHCANHVSDAGETDLDCGGTCGATCDGGQQCSSNADCLHGCDTANGVCFYGTPRSCRDILIRTPGLPSGVYTIRVFDTYRGPVGMYRDRNIYCDMDTAGGGWTLAWVTSPEATPPFTNKEGYRYGAYFEDDDSDIAPFLGSLGVHPSRASTDDYTTMHNSYYPDVSFAIGGSLDLRTEWNNPFWSEFRMSSYSHYGTGAYAEYNGPAIPKSALRFRFGDARGWILSPELPGFGNYMCFGPDNGVGNSGLPWTPGPVYADTCNIVGGRNIYAGYLYVGPDNSSIEMDQGLTDVTTIYTPLTTPACTAPSTQCYIGPEGFSGASEFLPYELDANSLYDVLHLGASHALWVR